MRANLPAYLCVVLVAGCGDDTPSATDAAAPTTDSAVRGDTSEPEAQETSDPDVADTAQPDTSVQPDSSVASDTSVAPDAPLPLPEPVMEGYVRRVGDTWWANMDDFVFGVVEPSGVRLYLSLFDGNFYRREEHRAFGQALVRHPESFFANALVPLLERYAPALWAIDCVNEPEAMIAGADGNYQGWGVSWDEMRGYLAACAEVVHTYGPGIAVSAGSGWHDWHNVGKGYFDGLGFDHLDFHVYGDTIDPPPAASLAEIPVIIGECGQRTERWDDALQLAATRDCFANAHARGYAAAMSWYYDYAGSTNHLAHKNADDSWRPVRQAFDEAIARGQLVGLNLAWLSGAYDHDFGLNPLHPEWGVGYARDAVGRVVADYDAVGIPLMRLWAFEGQEALVHHLLYGDFVAGAGDGAGYVAFGPSALLVSGDGIGVDIRGSERAWYGIEHPYHPDAPLDLRAAREWTFEVVNDLGRAVGVNLAFVIDDGASRVTYQTRNASQLWLEDGASGSGSVPLDAARFSAGWALDSAPAAGASHPGDALANVVAVRVRVHLDGSTPVSGALRLRRIAITP